MPAGAFSRFADNFLHKLDVAIRRQSRLGKFPKLRKLLLGPYRKLINLHGRGVLMNIGGCIPARMPPDYAWKSVEDYEPESLAALKRWMEKSAEPVLVDVGCSFGIVSCAGLFSNPSARVIALDSDRQSLKSTQRMCACAPNVSERLFLVWGFASDEPTQAVDFRDAHQTTLRALAQPGITGKPDDVHYVCLDSDAGEASIARHSLDHLIPSESLPGASILLKCDVEGAELLVLKGASRLLSQRHPALLISVHPPTLPKYGATKEEVRSFLSSHGYAISILAIDHEEHWWCFKS
jgi:FkbM family methyltransferase